jgi:hypothetical protein
VNQPQEKTEQKSGRHKWLRRSLLAVIIIIAIIVLARVTLPYSIIFGATTWLEKQGVHTTIEDIRIDVIGGKFTLVNATGTIDQTPAFHVGLIDIHWQWRPLSKKVIHIERVALQGLKLDIAQYSDAIDVAGITVPLGSETPPVTDTPDENDTIDWAASLNEIDFSDLDVCYTKYVSTQATAGKPALDYCTAFKALRWNGNIGFATDSELARQQDVPLVSDGDFSLSGFTVTDRRLGRTLLNSSQTTLSHVSIKGLNQISIDEIDIDKLSALQRNDEQHRDTVRFNSLQIAGIRLKNLNALNIDSIRLDAPGLFIAKDAGGAWEYAQWISELPAAGENKDDANDNAGAFLLAIHQIQVNDSDFCYDEAAGQLYYCLNLAALDWKGSAAFDKEPLYVTGELQLDGLKIRNRTLQRDLLDLGRLSATSIDIKKTTSVKIGTLVIDSLRALQRTDKADDDSLKFKQLDISSIAYKDNKLLNIGKIKLDGLGVSLSMNKDGMWEFDKWKTASTDAASPKIKTDKSEEGGDKLDIALGEFSLSTDQNVEFSDESMSPALNIGLNKIDFNIKQLDSRKADHRSPFSLNASTTRRGTIKVAGVVSPFEAKPSFDAKGKISGIDLRALSPATKKYVGHIIRSGQLDAADHPDNVHHSAGDPGRLGSDPEKSRAVHGCVPDHGRFHDRCIRGAGLDAVLRVLGRHADPDVPDHRHLGRRAPGVRNPEVLHLHLHRLGVHAGVTDLHVLPGWQLRDPGYAEPQTRHDRADADLPVVPDGVRGQGADVAGAHVVAGCARGSADRRFGDPGGDHAENRRLRFPAFQPADHAGREPRTGLADHPDVAGRGGLHRLRRAGAERHEKTGGVFVHCAHGFRHAGYFHRVPDLG